MDSRTSCGLDWTGSEEDPLWTDNPSYVTRSQPRKIILCAAAWAAMPPSTLSSPDGSSNEQAKLLGLFVSSVNSFKLIIDG
ncbi:hypothetical protein D5086_005195 [Populus alba]|uniref:Uncharacterized protein n=1 Tax=Populus alba TaxID=43335 RepID=A0ACC4CSJ8_POPAL